MTKPANLTHIPAAEMSQAQLTPLLYSYGIGQPALLVLKNTFSETAAFIGL